MRCYAIRPFLVHAAQWFLDQPIEGVEPYHVKDSIQDKWIGRVGNPETKLFFLNEGDWLVLENGEQFGYTDKDFHRKFELID